jgi:major vault protein
MAIDMVKRPLGVGQFAWAMSKKEGKYKILIGPDALEATDDDLFFISDPADPTKIMPVGNPSEAIQDFITIKTGQYAVLHNPSETTSADFPNANYTSGKNEMKPLLRGRKRTVTAGHFPLWPGQSVEIRDVPVLSSNQYLMVKVESLNVDTSAPYYETTIKCAGITKAVVDETVGSEDGGDKLKIGDVTDTPPSGATEGEELAKKDDAASKADQPTEPVLKVGQNIIIPASLVPTYIIPSGLEEVAEEVVAAQVEDDAALSPADLVEKMITKGILKIENLGAFCEKARIGSEYTDKITEIYSTYRRDNDGRRALSRAIGNVASSTIYKMLAQVLLDKTSENKTTNSAVRQAVVLGPTEFCVLFDEDGKPRTHKGPGRVFPGPYDVFRTEGSRNRVYDAYHLRVDRGILMRIVADRISRQDLARQLPEGAAGFLEEKDFYGKGDEIFIEGFDAYLVPSSSIEVINPETRQPHIGNDHSEVYVYSIGVDQKSGVYVANVSTGNITLIKGEKKVPIDPRKSKHVKRRIPKDLWNLMIGKGEPHKMTNQAMVETPWAMNVMISNNEAVMVTSKDSRRVVVGPRMELLEYDEWLEVLTLSKGRPKNEDETISTCFLRVTGNRITDQFYIETSDFVKIKIDVVYGVEFVGTTDDERAQWFNDPNYVMLLCNNLRSRYKLAARKKTLKELYPIIPDFLRNTALGEKKAEEGKDSHRPGLRFEENNMLLKEVEVLNIYIPDDEISEALIEHNRTVIKGEMDIAIARASLETAKARNAIDIGISEIRIEKAERIKEVELKEAATAHEVEIKRNELAHAISELVALNQAAIAKINEQTVNDKAYFTRVRLNADSEAEIGRESARRLKIVEFRNALKEIQVALIQATSKADVERLQAIQAGMIEAIEGLGDKQLMTSLAEHLPQATGSLGLLLGKGGLDALTKMISGTPFASALNALQDDGKTVMATAEQIEKTAEETSA